MYGRTFIVKILAVAMSALVFGISPIASVAYADSAQQQTDQLHLTKISATEYVGAGRNESVRFDATLNYQVKSIPRGIVALFVLEDNAVTASVDSSEGKWLSSGTGEVQLTTSYKPSSPERHMLTLVAGLFNESKTLVAWTKTQQFSLSSLPGRAQFDRALTEYNAGQFANAANDFSAAIQATPDVGLYYCWRADTLTHLGKYDDAVADYSHALGLIPNDRGCLVGRGIAFLWKGDQKASIADLSTVIDHTTTPDRWTAWALRARGVAYAGLGDYAAAIANYQAYLSIVPNAPDQSQVQGWIAQLQAAQSNRGEVPASSN